jgi:hypothetical protein
MVGYLLWHLVDDRFELAVESHPNLVKPYRQRLRTVTNLFQNYIVRRFDLSIDAHNLLQIFLLFFLAQLVLNSFLD